MTLPDAFVSAAKDAVCERFGITREKLMHGGHHRIYARPRQVLMWILRARGLSHSQVGLSLGGLDHTTVLHGTRVIAEHPELLAVASEIALMLELADGLRTAKEAA